MPPSPEGLGASLPPVPIFFFYFFFSAALQRRAPAGLGTAPSPLSLSRELETKPPPPLPSPLPPACHPKKRSRGSVVFNSSVAGVVAIRSGTVYAMTKVF